MKKRFMLFLIVVLLVTLIIMFINKDSDSKTKVNKKYAYSNTTVEKFKNLEIDDDVNLDKYSKTLETAVNSENFDKNNIKIYESINYQDVDNFINLINLCVSENINVDDINYIVSNYTKFNNFDYLKAKRYINYKNLNTDLEDRLVVTRVNLNLDIKFYEGAKKIEDPDNLLVLVNKFNYLDQSFVPKNMKPLFNKTNVKMVDVAADAYEKLVKAAKDDGITLIATTAYRSYSFQSTLYNNYKNKDGADKADRYSARPGYSEHQTGLAVDLDDPNYKPKRISPSDYEWLKNNSYKYGFILRYPENSESITGYMEENWHIRYLGEDTAKKVHDSKLTYDEYYDIYIR